MFDKYISKIQMKVLILSFVFFLLSVCHVFPIDTSHKVVLVCAGHEQISPNILTIKVNETKKIIVTNPIDGAPAPEWRNNNPECLTIDPLTGLFTNATGIDSQQTICVAHLEVTQDGCVGTAIINVVPATSQCDRSPQMVPAKATVSSTGTQVFKVNNIGDDPSQTKWSNSHTFCASISPTTGETVTATAHNSAVTQCFTDITAVNGPCYAQGILQATGAPQSCTSTTTEEPPVKSGLLGVTLYNDTACHFKDDNVYVYLIASQDTAPGSYYVITNTSTSSDGYPIYTLGLPTVPAGGLAVPFFKLDALNKGGFYLKGGTSGTNVLANARFYISLGSELPSFTLANANFFNQPTEITPWDIFEFGYDPNKVKAFGFNTSQVAGFSVPLWFKITPVNNIPSNPANLPLGLKLRDNSTPVRLGSQKQIINYYETQNATGPELFRLSNLGQTDSNGNQRIQAPADQGVVIPPAQTNYFDSSFASFKSFYASTYPSWTFRMCTSDPGASSTVPYPGCAASGSMCTSVTTFPQCTTGGNTCVGVPPTGNRNIGTCYVGYTVANTFYYFTYQNDVAPSGPCGGSAGYNGSTVPTLTAPAGGQGGLCSIDLDSIPAGLTKTTCALQNNCYNDVFNPQIMAAMMRNVVTNRESAPPLGYTRWTFLPPTSPTSASSKYYQTQPYNFYARIWHELGIDFYAYGFGFDDAGGQSTTYTPNASTLSNVVIGIGW